jgi:hypothetical protein
MHMLVGITALFSMVEAGIMVSDTAELRTALSSSAVDGNITIDLDSGTYLLDGAQLLVHALHVTIQAVPATVVLDGMSKSRIFDVAHGARLTLSGVRLTGGAKVENGGCIQVGRQLYPTNHPSHISYLLVSYHAACYFCAFTGPEWQHTHHQKRGDGRLHG